MNKLTKLIASLVVISLTFIGSLELITRGCGQLEHYREATNENSFIENICSNRKIEDLYQNYNFNSLNDDVTTVFINIKTYPFLKTLKTVKFKTERYILNFDYKAEVNNLKVKILDYKYKSTFENIKQYILDFDPKATYASIKRHVVINYEQLRHFIFFKYQVLTSNKEQWKARYQQKIEAEKEVAFTNLGNIKDLLSDVAQSKSTTAEDEIVPVVTSKNEVENYSNYGVMSFEDSSKSVDKMSDKMVNEMLQQMEDLEKSKIKEMKPIYVEKIKQINQLANDRMAELSTMIREINNCELVNGTYYYNKTNSECEYAPITREKFRGYFNETKTILQQHSKDLVEIDYKTDLIELEKKLDDLKLLQVDTFEDWGDSTIEKLKEILTYENIALGSQEDQKMLSKWQELTSLKNEIIKKRDVLVELSLNFEAMQEFVKELKKNIGVLAHEGGDRLYIIRAKANLEFQEREKPKAAEKKEVEQSA